jgi:hypothetical protein
VKVHRQPRTTVLAESLICPFRCVDQLHWFNRQLD